MDVVLDANVLFRILISPDDILDIFFHPELDIAAPVKLLNEFEKNRDEILSKSQINDVDFSELLEQLMLKINIVPIAEYERYLSNAKQLLKEHLKDEDFVALSLHLSCNIWTYEDRLFKIGVAVSTKQIKEELQKHIS